jgi:Protein of unknown function (DUF3574)
MNTLSLLRQGVLFAHLVAFAVALGAVLREDAALLARRRVDLRRIASSARTLTVALAVLWASGLALIGLDIGFDPRAIAAAPKLAAKLVVVAVLTGNGVALHALAFPMLRQRDPRLALPLLLGAVSTTSWLYASFVGASRLVAPWLSFTHYMAMYALLLLVAAAVALIVVGPLLRRPRAVDHLPKGTTMKLVSITAAALVAITLAAAPSLHAKPLAERTAKAAVVAVADRALAEPRVARCPGLAGADAFARTELFFGLSRPGGVVSEAEFKGFVDAAVTPRFPDGLTLLTGVGQFRDSSGTIVVEGSKLLILLYARRDRDADAKIEQIRNDYKAAFEQQSVLRADDVSCVSF